MMHWGYHRGTTCCVSRVLGHTRAIPMCSLFDSTSGKRDGDTLKRRSEFQPVYHIRSIPRSDPYVSANVSLSSIYSRNRAPVMSTLSSRCCALLQLPRVSQTNLVISHERHHHRGEICVTIMACQLKHPASHRSRRFLRQLQEAMFRFCGTRPPSKSRKFLHFDRAIRTSNKSRQILRNFGDHHPTFRLQSTPALP